MPRKSAARTPLHEVPAAAAGPVSASGETLFPIYPHPSVDLRAIERGGSKLWLSPNIYISLPDPAFGETLQLSGFDLHDDIGKSEALEIRWPGPEGLPWLTIEFTFGADALPILTLSRELGFRMRARGFPPTCIIARLAIDLDNGTQIFDLNETIDLHHAFQLYETAIPTPSILQSRAADISNPRIYLGLPRDTYFAVNISYFEMFTLS